MISAIIDRTLQILDAVLSNPVVYLPLIGNWFITAIYFIVNSDEQRGHTYVMSSGIAHMFTAYVISPFATSELSWSSSDIRVLIVAILFGYGLLMVIIGILRKFPDILAEFFGDPGHALVPGMMAILLVDNNIPFDLLTACVLVVFPLFMGGISLYRKVKQ